MAFKLKSGNGPLKFKNMGSSPIRHDDPVSHSHPDNIREHYGSYAGYLTDMEKAGVDPMPVEEWQKKNDENILQAEMGGVQNWEKNREAYWGYLDWSRDVINEKEAIQKEQGTYEELNFTPGLAEMLIREGVLTREQANIRLAEQEEINKAKETENE